MLRKKMLRDIRKNVLAYAACSMMIAIALMTYVSMSGMMDTMNKSKEAFYSDYRFAEGFAYVQSMPISALEDLQRVEGIGQITGNLVLDVRVLFPDRKENVYIRLVSVNLQERERLNDIWIPEGSPLEKGQRSILTGIKFFDANQMVIGRKITAVIRGRKVELTIAGKAQSPDYVYAMKDTTDLFPSARDFGIGYISYDVMENLFHAEGTINQVSFTLKNDASFEDVKNRLEAELEQYHLSGIVKREDQTSHFMLKQELMQLEETASSIPMLFLLLSTVILWIMLKRLVEHQRMQIGMLKAGGYSSAQIMGHYISYTVVIGMFGGAVGGILGYFLSSYMVEMYNEFFTLPNLQAEFSLRSFVSGIAVSVLFSGFAGFMGGRKVFGLEPAVSMQRPAPVSGRKIFLENLHLFWKALTVQGRMAVRNIFRSKARSAFTVIGAAFAFSLMACLFSFLHMFDTMIMDNFKYIQKYDARISLALPGKADGLLREIQGFRGVELAEPLLEVPVTLIHGHVRKDSVLMGIKEDSNLYHVVDNHKTRIPVNDTGILLAQSLAGKLGVQPGDILEVECGMADSEDLKLRVIDTFPQYIGTNGYTTTGNLNRLLGTNGLASALLVKAPPEVIENIREKLTLSQMVSVFEEIKETKKKYADLLDQFFFMLYALVVLAILTGFAIVYISGIISMSERERELASLKVLGMTDKEVLQVASFEQNFLAGFGMIFGIPMAYLFNRILAQNFNTELYSFPEVILPVDFIIAFAGTVFSLFMAFLFMRRKVKELDMVEVLKARE
jgi:putative ABC transport system permease protein